MIDQAPHKRYLTPATAIIAACAAVNILFHLLLPEYGYHRDEMYYVSVADGFTFANFDMPPLAPLYLKLFLVLFGHSLKVVHLASSAAGSLAIVFACLIAREMGGGKYAIALTGLFSIFSGLVIFGSLYTYDCVSFVLWMAVFYLVVRMLNGGSQKLWLLAGILMGLGFLAKMTILFLGTGLFLALWLVPERAWFRQRWIWIGGVTAILCAIPIALWQARHGWYFFQYAGGYAGRTTHAFPVLEFLWNQILPNNFALLPVWLIGGFLLVASRHWRRFRLLGYCYLALIVLTFILGGQFYFIIPVYLVLIAAGTVNIERRLEARSAGGRPGLIAYAWRPALFLLVTAVFLPMVVPLLPVEQLVEYVKPLGVNAGIKTEDSRLTLLPQHFADRFGWVEMAGDVAEVYREARDTGRGELALVAANWGEAGALHVNRERFGLPEPMCPDGWFYFEGLKREEMPERCVAIGFSQEYLKPLFRHVEQRGVFTNQYCMPHENGHPIFYCYGLKVNLRSYWMAAPDIHPVMGRILRDSGVARAVAFVRLERSKDSTLMFFTEQRMNRLGYDYLRNGRVEDALQLFRLNAETYPDSYNVYDSMGEALMAEKKYAEAEASYNRSLELNPGNDNAREKLKELVVLTGGAR